MRIRVISLVVILSVVCLTIPFGLGSQSSSITISSEGVIRHSSLTWLHTDGKYIKNEAGQIVQLTGVGWMDYMNDYHTRPEPVGSEPFGKLDYRLNRHKELGINCIRISINQKNWEGSNSSTNRYIDQLDYVVQKAAKLGIYVYFCFHYGSGGQDDFMAALLADHNYDGYRDWAKEVALRYKDYPNVCAIQNWAEPAWGGYTNITELERDWATFQLDTAKAIHSVNLNLIVIVPSPGHYSHKWVSDYWLTHPLPEPNIAYCWQIYYKHHMGENWAQNYQAGNFDLARQQLTEWHRQHGLKMVDAGIAPVILAETGFFSLLDHYANEAVMARDWLEILNDYQQSWTYWLWYDSPYKTGSTGMLYEDWYSLTPVGEVVVAGLVPLPTPP